MCSGIAYGVYWFFFKRNVGPVYTEEPIVNILQPSGSNWYATGESTIALSGIASDDKSKIKKVEWEADSGSSGTADGTDEWTIDEVELSEGDNKVTIKASDTSGNVGEDSIFVVYNSGVEFVGSLVADPDYLYKDDPAVSVTFNVTLKKEIGVDVTSVTLYLVDGDGEIIEEVDEMKDSGLTTDGDDIPGDSTYSMITSLLDVEGADKYYRANAVVAGESNMSGSVKIISIEHMSENALDQITSLNEQVSDLMGQLEADGANVGDIANQVNDMVGQQDGITANGLSEQGTGVWWVYENTCIPGGVLITEPGVKGGPEGTGKIVSKAYAQDSDVEVESTKAIFLGPYVSDFGEADDYYGGWAKVKESVCPECETTEVLNTDVTVDHFKGLSNYGLILVSSHGDNWYGGLSGDNMCAEGFQQSQIITYTNQQLTEENYAQYEADLMARRLAVGFDNRLIVLPSYISHYNGSFPNSVVYISTCRSAYNNTLAAAFLGNGAQAYFGYDDYVLASYTYSAGSALFDEFVLEGKNVGESFTEAVSTAGSSDGQGADFLWAGYDQLKMGGQRFVNVGFESSGLNGWANVGDARVISSLGPILASEGSFMAIISTGLGSVSDSSSTLAQEICYGGDEGTLMFDYNLVSEEPMEYVDSEYDDRLAVVLTIEGSAQTILSAGVNDSSWNAVSGIDFTGGDSTTFMTGWETVTASLEGVDAQSTILLNFSIGDVGDSDYDTAALIDNIRIE